MDRTAEDLRARLRANPNDHEAFQALRAHYQRRSDYASLANLLEGWANRSPDPRASSQAFFEAAELVGHYLGDSARSISLYERALERNPRHTQASERLLAAVEATGDTMRLLELLQRRSASLARAGDRGGAAAVEYRIGQLYETTMSRPDRAVGHYRRAFEADGTLVAAIYGAREIYRREGNLKAAAQLFDLEIKAEPTRDRRVALLRELAHMRSTELHDVPGGIDALERALEQAPGDLAVLHELSTLLLQRAAKRGQGAASEQERFRAADLLYQLAQSTPPDHAIAYCETALDAIPAHDGAMELLERLARDQGRNDLLPARWVGYLRAAPTAPGADVRRKRLGYAYLEAGQPDDAIACLEPLLEHNDAEAAEALVDLYRTRGEHKKATRALSIAVGSLPKDQQVPRLREIVDSLVAQGEIDDAIARAEEILRIAPDPEAIQFLETQYRKRKDDGALRDLMLFASRAAGAPVEARIERLREVAALSETKLQDPEGAIGAYRAILAIDPTQSDARDALAKKLEEAQRWDELVDLLEQRALATTEPDTKASILVKIAKINRDQLGRIPAAIHALDRVREIRPDDRAARDELCDVMLQSDRAAEAVPLLEERIVDADTRDDRIALLELLASTYESRLGDDDRAFAAATRLLDEDPDNENALDRMERIDIRGERYARLLDTLSYRVEVTPTERRAEIVGRIGQIADERLGDLNRAADYYQQALDLQPDNGAVLDALCSVYVRGERYRDLVVLLRKRADEETKDPRAKAELYRRIARTLATQVQNPDAAAEAWERVLEPGDDLEALSALADHAQSHAKLDDLVNYLDRIEPLIAQEAKVSLTLRQVDALVSLERHSEAAGKLRKVVLAAEPENLKALTLLAECCSATGDKRGLADALEKRLQIMEDPGLRLPLARKLSDLYETELEDKSRAIISLNHWIASDPNDTRPRERLISLLEAEGRHRELLDATDGLIATEPDYDRRLELSLKAAELAWRQLGDLDGAWNRLEPLISYSDRADELLRELAESNNLHLRLAGLYVAIAQSDADPRVQQRRWNEASDLYAGPLSDANNALEAALRAFAINLQDRETLERVDSLSIKARAWPRLAQVYDKLIREETDIEAKTELLLRHAKLLETEAREPSEALDRVLRACSLKPDDDALLLKAEELAPQAGRADELLFVYERRKSQAATDDERIEALLSATRLCDEGLKDRSRAFQYIAQAVALTLRSPELREVVETRVIELDSARPELGKNDAARNLVELYHRLAEEDDDNVAASAEMLARASRILDETIQDGEAAFTALRLASTHAVTPEILDGLGELAERLGHLTQLDQHLERLVRDALDSYVSAELLRRRGALLRGPLNQPGKAADVYAQLLTVERGNPETSDLLFASLKDARRHQDLQMALEKDLRGTTDSERKERLLRELADLWENALGNKWEAVDAWKKVLALVPDDTEASAALERLGQQKRVGTAELMLPDASAREELVEELAAVEEPADEAPSAPLDLPPPPSFSAPPQEAAPEQSLAGLTPLDEPESEEFFEVGENTSFPSDTPGLQKLKSDAPSLAGFEEEFTYAESVASLEEEFGVLAEPEKPSVDAALQSPIDAMLSDGPQEASISEVPVRDSVVPPPAFEADPWGVPSPSAPVEEVSDLELEVEDDEDDLWSMPPSTPPAQNDWSPSVSPSSPAADNPWGAPPPAALGAAADLGEADVLDSVELVEDLGDSFEGFEEFDGGSVEVEEIEDFEEIEELEEIEEFDDFEIEDVDDVPPPPRPFTVPPPPPKK